MYRWTSRLNFCVAVPTESSKFSPAPLPAVFSPEIRASTESWGGGRGLQSNSGGNQEKGGSGSPLPPPAIMSAPQPSLPVTNGKWEGEEGGMWVLVERVTSFPLPSQTPCISCSRHSGKTKHFKFGVGCSFQVTLPWTGEAMAQLLYR